MTAESPYQEYQRITRCLVRPSCSKINLRFAEERQTKDSIDQLQQKLIQSLDKTQRILLRVAIANAMKSDALVQQGKSTRIVIPGEEEPVE